MKLKQFYSLCERFAPVALSREYCEKYGAYDNSGILLGEDVEITGALFALDCTVRAVELCKEKGYNLLVTHHPAIYSPVKGLREECVSERAVLAAARAGISIICMHLNLDCAEGGIDEELMRGLGGADATVMHPLSSGGYGRAYEVDTDCAGLLKTLRGRFGAERIAVYGENKPLTRIASFCGAGMDEQSLGFAIAEGAQAIVTSDGKHHLIMQAMEADICLLLPTHYAVERYGFEKYYEKIKREAGLPCYFYTDERLL